MEGASGELAGRLEEGRHLLDQRVYYEDTDFSGFVYHARYLHFLERGRTDWLRLLGIDQSTMAQGENGTVFVVRRMEIDFRVPARMDDIVTVTTHASSVKGARLTLAQTLSRKGETLLSAIVEVAIVDTAGRPRRLPPDLRSILPSVA